MTRSAKLANFTLAGVIIICVAVFAYAFSSSGSRSPGSTYKYYIVSIVFLSFLVFALRKFRDETKLKVAMLLVSVTVSIYLLDASLMIYGITIKNIMRPKSPFSRSMAIAGKKGLPFDPRNKLQIVKDLRKNGLDVYPHAFPSNYIGTDGLEYKGTKVFPLGAISNRTTVFCNEEGTPVIYETDEHGFRNPKGQYDIGSIDIALIGDSFAQGFCVKNGEDIAGRLRQNNRKVLNLGMEGSGPLIELGILSEYAKPFKPKLVLWLYYEGNDMPNLSWEKAPTLMKYLENSFSQNIVQSQAVADNALISYVENEEKKVAEEIIPESYIWDFKSITIRIIKLVDVRMMLGIHSRCIFNIDPLFKDILIQAKSRVESYGGQIYFVYLPANVRYTHNICRKRWLHLQRAKIISQVKDLNINVIDMTEYFDAHNDPRSLFLGHYNSKGYGLVAQKIEERLE